MDEVDGGWRKLDDDDVGEAGWRTDTLVVALQGMENVNLMFALGAFLFLNVVMRTWNPTNSLADRDCAAGKEAVQDMAYFLAFSFGCFFFSTIWVHCLKLDIVPGRQLPKGLHLWGIWRWLEKHGWGPKRVSRALLVLGVLVPVVGLVFGCGFTMRALVNAVQIRLGKLDCADATARTIKPLIILVPTGLLTYVSTVLYHAFTC